MRPVIAMIVATAIAAAGAAGAQDAVKQNGAAEEAPSDFAGLGEIMALQQMRHIKLWFAGKTANWPLADYEIGELKEGFEDVTKLLGGDIVSQHVGAPISKLEKSIDSKDSVAFAAAFDKLSAGCNACHRTLDHGFIAIQRPQMLPYSDQDFAPQKQ
jgi:hypothetical protein